MDTQRIHIPNIERFFIVSFLILSLLAFARIGFLAHDLSIHEDEYQHTHLAWNALNGKVIYRDFQDSHGPLSNIWYRQILGFFTRDGASTQSFYKIRYFNLLVVLMTGCCLGINIFLISNSGLATILGTTIYFLSPIIATVSFRIRPDCYVGLFSSLSLLCWLKKKYFWTGLCLGICLGFHGKFLPVNLIILAMGCVLLRKEKKLLYFFLAGEVLVLGAVAFWFWYQRALSFAFDGMIGSGIQTAFKRIVLQGDFNRLFRSSIRSETWLMLLLGIGMIPLSIRFYHAKKNIWNSNWGMTAVYSIAGILFLLAPVWAHAFVFVLPLIIPFLVSAFFSFPVVGKSVSVICLACGVFFLIQDPRKTDRSKELLEGQLNSLEKALVETNRTDPIFYIWTSRCPAYVFNSDPRPNWTQSFKRIDKRQPIRQLPPINYLAIHPIFLSALDQDEREYIQEHFQADGCFWKRIK